MGDAPIRGSCLCGGIGFEVAAKPPIGIGICHCSRCRKTGGPANVTVLAESFQWIRGEELVVRYEPEPPFNLIRSFCRVCGTHLGVPETHPKLFPIAAAVFDDDPVARPVLHEYVDDKAPWYEIHDDLPQYPRDPPLPAFAPKEK